MALILIKFEYHEGLGSPYKAYKPREGPPIRFEGQQGQPRDNAPKEATAEEGQVTLAQILNNQHMILNNLQLVMTNQQELKDTQQEMKIVQIEFQNETHNRIAALSECVFSMEQILTTPQPYTSYRRPNTHPRTSTSSALATLPQAPIIVPP